MRIPCIDINKVTKSVTSISNSIIYVIATIKTSRNGISNFEVHNVNLMASTTFTRARTSHIFASSHIVICGFISNLEHQRNRRALVTFPFTVSVSPINLQHEEDVDAIMHSLDGDFAAGVDLVFVWVERRQQGELRGLHAVPVVAVAVHGHLPGAELRENAPTATGARGRLAVVLVRGGGREEGRGGCQDDQEPRHAGARGSRLRDRAEPEALSVVGDSESLKVRLVSHTAAAAACRLENEEASVAGLVGAWKFRICP